jgi:hypothetical protein
MMRRQPAGLTKSVSRLNRGPWPERRSATGDQDGATHRDRGGSAYRSTNDLHQARRFADFYAGRQRDGWLDNRARGEPDQLIGKEHCAQQTTAQQ